MNSSIENILSYFDGVLILNFNLFRFIVIGYNDFELFICEIKIDVIFIIDLMFDGLLSFILIDYNNFELLICMVMLVVRFIFDLVFNREIVFMIFVNNGIFNFLVID